MRSGRWACGRSMAVLRLPAMNSISRYWNDWKPLDWPSASRKLVYSDGVMVRSTSQARVELLEDPRDPRQHLEGRLQPVAGDRHARCADLVDRQPHPQLRRLVLDDEQHLVMGVRQRRLGVEDTIEAQVVAIGHASREGHLGALAGGVVGLAAHRRRLRSGGIGPRPTYAAARRAAQRHARLTRTSSFPCIRSRPPARSAPTTPPEVECGDGRSLDDRPDVRGVRRDPAHSALLRDQGADRRRCARARGGCSPGPAGRG